jgi:cytochrome P450
MALHPEVQNRGQKEIDAALHGSRLPTFQDHDSLPYIDCIVKELFRWATPTPLGKNKPSISFYAYRILT